MPLLRFKESLAFFFFFFPPTALKKSCFPFPEVPHLGCAEQCCVYLKCSRSNVWKNAAFKTFFYTLTGVLPFFADYLLTNYLQKKRLKKKKKKAQLAIPGICFSKQTYNNRSLWGLTPRRQQRTPRVLATSRRVCLASHLRAPRQMVNTEILLRRLHKRENLFSQLKPT